MNGGLSFHHLGLLSSRPEVTAGRLEALGYSVREPVTDDAQGVVLRMARMGGSAPAVEVITPLCADSPLGRQLLTRDNSIYHLCYVSPSFDSAEAALAAGGGRVFPVSPPKDAVLFGGRRVAFYFVDGLGLVEIIEAELSYAE